MQYVQLVLTDEHVAVLRDALHDYSVPPGVEATQLQMLELFLARVAENPSHFPVTGSLATSIKNRMRTLKGPAQPRPANARKARQARRIRASKERRRTRRADAAAYNEARERMEAEHLEWQALQQERATQRGVLFGRDTLTHEELAELFELIDLPHVAKYARDWYALTPDERLALAAEVSE